jgi:hypothetical protein
MTSVSGRWPIGLLFLMAGASLALTNLALSDLSLLKMRTPIPARVAMVSVQ